MNRQMTIRTSGASHSPKRRSMTLLGVVAIGAATIALTSVVTATPATINGIILLVGANESQRVVNWYASANTSQVVVRNNLLYVENLRSGTCVAPNAAVEVGNVDWCGPNDGASPALPVGSLVDKVVIHPARR